MLDDITRDLAADEGGKFAADALDGQCALQEIEIRLVIDPDIDVGNIALVAGARMRDVANDAGDISFRGVPLRRVHATKTSTFGLTSSRAMRTDFVITLRTIPPPKPPPPAGPPPNTPPPPPPP